MTDPITANRLETMLAEGITLEDAQAVLAAEEITAAPPRARMALESFTVALPGVTLRESFVIWARTKICGGASVEPVEGMNAELAYTFYASEDRPDLAGVWLDLLANADFIQRVFCRDLTPKAAEPAA